MSRPVLAFIYLSILFLAVFPPGVRAAERFTSAYVNLLNGRQSFLGLLTSAISAGASVGVLSTSGTADKSTTNLFPNDIVCFNNPASNGCANQINYTVIATQTDAVTFSLTAGVAGGVLANNNVVASQSGRMVVAFTPYQTVPVGGHIRVAIPAAASEAASEDGIPNIAGFDFAQLGVAATLTANTTIAGTGNPTIASSTITYGSSAEIMDFTTATATLAAGSSYVLTIGHATNGALQLINPAPIGTAGSHTTGTADAFAIALETQNASATALDAAVLRVAVNDGVQVNVNVPLIIEHIMAGVGSSAACAGSATTLTSTSTANEISYGTGANSANTLYTMAQKHTVNTNAPSGYVLTAYNASGTVNGPLMIQEIGQTTRIPHTACDSGTPCTSSTWGAWIAGARNGFGFTTDQKTGNQYQAFSYDPATPNSIRTTAAPVSNEDTYVCYRLSFAGTQRAGYYSGTIIYAVYPRF